MQASELAELRTMYIFSPPPGQTWGLTYSALKDRLLERDPDSFIQVEDPRSEPLLGGRAMHFGITLSDEALEGVAKLDPEGIALNDGTAALAAEFSQWLRDQIVPQGQSITFNTEWGWESDVADALVPEASQDEVVEQFIAHLVATGDLD
ncbi:hypothetical protein ACIBUY_03855 [Streptomyces sp. NPDC050085]|uniref:hypothetical protein n=1 Tax=Streptomyces sp. NPDC050085 TaxID=3365600 RepID=UPI00378B0817